jgi:ketosteroid isomerase-like protein
MSQENVELAWQAARAWNGGGIEAFLSYLDPEVMWHAPQESMEPGNYRGHAGVRYYFGRLTEVSMSNERSPSTSSMSMPSASSRSSG